MVVTAMVATSPEYLIISVFRGTQFFAVNNKSVRLIAEKKSQ